MKRRYEARKHSGKWWAVWDTQEACFIGITALSSHEARAHADIYQRGWEELQAEGQQP